MDIDIVKNTAIERGKNWSANMQNIYYPARRLLSQKTSKLSASLILAASLAALAGCGGGGGGGAEPTAAAATSTTAGGTTTGTAAATGTAATTGGTTTATTGSTPAATGASAATGETTGAAGTTSAATGASATTGGTTTATGQSLSVRLSTDLTLVSLPPNNAKLYSAIVTDSAGQPVPGIEVRFVLRPGHYFAGNYAAAPATSTGRATQFVTAKCDNEDTDFTGIYDAGKDINNSGKLDPGTITSTSPSATTDANGVAVVRITYPKTHATWVEVRVEARIGVGVNDPPALAAFVLPGLIADYEFGGASSLDSISPYGATGVPPACIILP